jgi:formylmethanofuran dehydrogenase subunit A
MLVNAVLTDAPNTSAFNRVPEYLTSLFSVKLANNFIPDPSKLLPSAKSIPTFLPKNFGAFAMNFTASTHNKLGTG